MDFTIQIYRSLLVALKNADYSIQPFNHFLRKPESKVVILRHDVDLLPENSLRFARIQLNFEIFGSYYFRAVPQSWNENIIQEIVAMGHEVGYHYENMDTCGGNIDKAWDDFRYNLDKLRKLADVKTICMHGSPRSKFDNREIWKKYDYKSLGIIGEPYYDVDFDKFFYLTDTGRRWDGWKTSVRDKVPQQDKWTKNDLVFHSTQDIINAISSLENMQILKSGTGPNRILFDKVMMTFHPQRWHDHKYPWMKELVMQNIKNSVKKILVSRKEK